MTKQQLKEYCDAEFENIDAVVSELFLVVRADKTTYTTAELAAIAVFLHNFYNGVENILKRICSYRQIETKGSPTWHKDLLKASSEGQVISDELYLALSSYLSFRHFFIHSYSFILRWEELKPLVDELGNTLAQFKNEVYNSTDGNE